MLKYHFLPIRLATILNFANTLVGKGVGGKLTHTQNGNVNGHNSMKGNVAISVKFTNTQTYSV